MADNSFVDSDFPPDDTSLIWQDFGDAGGYAPPLGLSWIRPHEMGYWNGQQYRENPTLWGEDGYPHPNGFAQGGLGDCWFLAAASAVAEVPERITGLFSHEELLPQGIARMHFWVKDKWVPINIDTKIPSNQYDYGEIFYRTAFVTPGVDGGWWMPLIEKAYAKLDVNFDNIVGGWGVEGLRTLTGYPTHNVWFGEDTTKEVMEPIHKYWSA